MGYFSEQQSTNADERREAAFLLRVARAHLANGVTTCPAEAVDLAGQTWGASAAAEILALNAIATEEPLGAAAVDTVHHAVMVLRGNVA
jgi:Lon protease-like protein